jgi:serine/threonine protein kinase/Tol biopolymer transport system component
MAFSSGTRLGSYEIIGLLGAGGMGEVYRARDANLGRDVAIKVLPPDFAGDRERVARFQLEAQVLASLNHSNIGAIYDLQRTDATPFLVLELVPGETLAEKLSSGPLPAVEAIEIGKQIAEALEAAHERGIIHRDLKPANIKITPEGKVKVLDFGLAKMFEANPSPADLSQSPTMMSAETVILGTASYMSPEQARGRAVTKQTDIWALGCVLFQMLTGRVAFAGETVSDTIAKVLEAEPDWGAGRSSVPASLRRIVDRCLLKDTRRRFHDAGDVRTELEDALHASVEAPVATPAFKWGRLAALALLCVALGVAAAWTLWPDVREPVWTGTLLGPSVAYGPRISPDGQLVAFITLVNEQSQVGVINLTSGNWRVLTHTTNDGIIDQLSWSTDGTKIYFDREIGQPIGVYSVPALGGEPRLLLENASAPTALPDGSLVVLRINADRRRQLYRFTPDTGELQPLDAFPSDLATDFPGNEFRAFPDGTGVVFLDSSTLRILDLKSNRSRPFGPQLPAALTSFGLGVNPSDGSVVITRNIGDLHQILSVSRDGTDARVLFTLTDRSGSVDVWADGSIYVDQISRPSQILRFDESGQAIEDLGVIPVTSRGILELPGDRFLFTASFEGRRRLLVTRPGGEISPFIDSEQETWGPAAFAGPNRVAFFQGTPPEQSIAVASIADGRILQRRPIPASSAITSLTSSADGTTLFYSDSTFIWSLPVAAGEARQLGPGDAVAFDPHTGTLVVKLNSEDRVQLVRMPVSGGAQVPIAIRSDAGIPSFSTLGAHAVRADGHIAVPLALRDSWLWRAGILDPATGDIRKIPLRYDVDIASLNWNQKGKLIVAGQLFRSTIWRFRPESR